MKKQDKTEKAKLIHLPFDSRSISKPIVPSDEDGFKGIPSCWFNNSEFNEQFVGSIDYKECADAYFGSYSHFGIHEEMLKDEVRTKSYMNACLYNKEQFKDKIVLDIGCGTGILSIFAAKAGAKHVYGVDNAEIANFARAIVKDNHLEDTITIIKGKMEEIALPVEKVDIIISEWMGYFLLFESMLDTVLYARDKYLQPDGLLLPDRVCLSMVAIEDSKYKEEKYGFWNNVYDVNMKCIQQIALSEPLVDVVEKKLIISDAFTFFDLDLYTAKVTDLAFSNKYELKLSSNETVHALVGWFDAYFSKLENPIKLSTSPYSKYTHWKQTIFYLDKPIVGKKGESLSGSIAVRKSTTSFRDLDIKISYHYNDGQTKADFYQMYKLR